MNNSANKNANNLDTGMTTGSKVDEANSQVSLKSSDSHNEDALTGKNGKPPQRASAKRSGVMSSRA